MHPRIPRPDEVPAGVDVVAIGGPEEGDGVIPCPALVDQASGTVHVAYELNELEVAALAQGGTIWLTTWGMIPVHRHAVIDRDGNEVSG